MPSISKFKTQTSYKKPISMLLYFSSTFIHVITVVLKFIGKAQL